MQDRFGPASARKRQLKSRTLECASKVARAIQIAGSIANQSYGRRVGIVRNRSEVIDRGLCVLRRGEGGKGKNVGHKGRK